LQSHHEITKALQNVHLALILCCWQALPFQTAAVPSNATMAAQIANLAGIGQVWTCSCVLHFKAIECDIHVYAAIT